MAGVVLSSENLTQNHGHSKILPSGQPGSTLGNIPNYMKNLFDKFDAIRDKNVKEVAGLVFWDIVVLTTADEDQKEAYELQIQMKLKNKEIPSGLPYHVYSDPPGAKAGCGGSTMYVITELEKQYGAELKKYRILLINAGGQSQRLPSASILGKIFTALPMREPPYQVLELKLASYMTMLERMKPGFFHAASDTIEVFDLGMEGDWSFDKAGFTALAHPSTLDIGRTHGVYVLQDKSSGSNSHLAENRSCIEVLQKPSVERMRERGAIQAGGREGEFVYTDSVFYFDHGVSDQLSTFYRKNEPLLCEIDGYGDFLQALGPRSSIDYTKDLKNVSKVEPTLVETRQKIYNLLKDTPLNIICLNASCFYHLGTVQEYIDNYTSAPVLQQQIGMKNITFSVLEMDSEMNSKRRRLTPNNYSIIHSKLCEPSTIDDCCVVEYCLLESTVNIGHSCVISNCAIGPSEKAYNIPPNTFLHTAAISQTEEGGDSKAKHVPIVFHKDDSFKAKTQKIKAKELIYLSRTLDEVMKLLNVDLGKMVNDGEDETVVSLWDAKLFPVCDTMEDAFIKAVEISQCCSTTLDDNASNMDLSGYTTVSMRDILLRKSAAEMLDFRQNLHNKIRKL